MQFQRPENVSSYNMVCLRFEDILKRAAQDGYTFAIFQMCSYQSKSYFRNKTTTPIHACKIETLQDKLKKPEYKDLALTRMSYIKSYLCTVVHPVGRYNCEIMFTKDNLSARDIQTKNKRLKKLNFESTAENFGFSKR
jgi:hypothetical protein